MSLVNIAPFLWPGVTNGLSAVPSFITGATLDAAAEYVAIIVQAKEDMVISHVGWRTGTVAGAPTADTRIETVDTAGIPTGTLWTANTNLVSGTLVSNTWTLHALTASATITRGQFFAVKQVYNSGTSIIVQRVAGVPGYFPSNSPYAVSNTSGSPVKSTVSSNPLIALGSSATVFYSVPKSLPISSISASAFNNTGGERRGLRFKVPSSCRCAGISWFNGSTLGDANIVIYDDAGSVLTSRAMDGDQSSAANTLSMGAFFDTPVVLTAATWYRAALEPTTATNMAVSPLVMPSADYLGAWLHKENAHYTTFTGGGGWVDSATDTLPLLDLIVDQIDNGAGGGGGISRARAAGGW